MPTHPAQIKAHDACCLPHPSLAHKPVSLPPRAVSLYLPQPLPRNSCYQGTRPYDTCRSLTTRHSTHYSRQADVATSGVRVRGTGGV